jgi:hypothetical protein
MLSEGNASLPVECDSPLQIVMAVWGLFVLILTFWVRRNSHLLTIMVRLMAITICTGLSHTTRPLSRIVCRGKESPKGSKGTFRPDFQASTRPRISLKTNVTTEDRLCYKSYYVMSAEVNERNYYSHLAENWVA